MVEPIEDLRNENIEKACNPELSGHLSGNISLKKIEILPRLYVMWKNVILKFLEGEKTQQNLPTVI